VDTARSPTNVRVVFVASPEPVPAAGFADKKRAVTDELRGECRGATRAPQREAQLCLMSNGRQVPAEASEEDVLINGEHGVGDFVDGHDEPLVAVQHHMSRGQTR
jgi:hypothetical protein